MKLISKRKNLEKTKTEIQAEQQNMSSMIKSFFAPDSCLQGSEFPIHIIWDQEKVFNVQISFDSLLVKLKEIYNVDRNELKIEKEKLSINEFEKNGYVGFVFKSNIYREPSVVAPIKIEIEANEGERQVIKHEILLFRPHIVVHTMPKEISVVLRKDRKLLKNKISIKNEGKGTAIVYLDIAKESDVIVKMPAKLEEFIKKFCSVLMIKIQSIKRHFPEYSQIIDGFGALIANSVAGFTIITEEYIQKTRDILDKADKAFEENEDFLRDFAEAILSAYISSVHIITEIHSFFEYLKSLAENKVLLLNAASVIELKPGLNNISGNLQIQDLVYNVYEPKKINIKVKVDSDKPVAIPLYSMFEWSE